MSKRENENRIIHLWLNDQYGYTLSDELMAEMDECLSREERAQILMDAADKGIK